MIAIFVEYNISLLYMKYNLEKMIAGRANRMKSFFKPNNLPKLILLLAVLVVLYLFYVNYLQEGFDAAPEELESQIKDGKKMVLFYADWCGHCKKIKPDWDDAAKEANKEDKKMIKVNCGGGTEKDKELMSKYNIEGYPTIIIFDNGTPSEYSGKRTKDDFLSIFS